MVKSFDDPYSSRGDLITRSEAERFQRNLVIAQRKGLSEALAERVSRFKFVSQATVARIKAATEVVQAETTFMHAYREHQLIQQELFSVYEDAEKMRAIRDLDYDIAIRERQNRLHQLNRQSREYEGDGSQDAADIRRKERMNAEMKRVRLEEKMAIKNDLRRACEEAVRECLGDRSLSELTEEERRQIEDIRDSYQKLIDDL